MNRQASCPPIHHSIETLTDRSDSAFVASHFDVNSLVYEVVLHVYFVTRGNDHVSTRCFDSLVGCCGFSGSNRIKTQCKTTFTATLSYAVSKLSIATQL